MKFTDFALAVACALTVGGLIHEGVISVPHFTYNPLEPTGPSEAAAAVPTVSHAGKLWKREQLATIHGLVRSRTAEGTTVQCEMMAAEVNRYVNTGLGAVHRGSDGPGDKARLVDANRYGPLMLLNRGRWEIAKWRPGAVPGGIVRIFGSLPPGAYTESGAINVVAAPMGGTDYTTEFTMDSGDWMWEPAGKSLSRER